MSTNKTIEDINVLIPKSASNEQLPDPALLTFYKNYEKRIIWIDDEIDQYSIDYSKYIMDWNSEDRGIPIKDRRPITPMFFTPGGDLNVNNMLIDTITLSKTPIIGVNCGEAASAGCFIFLSCHKRYTFPQAVFLIHKGAGEFGGDYEKVVSQIIFYQEQVKKLGEFILSRTSIPQDVFDENFSSEWYLNADEAVKYGLCSKIITSLDEI